MCPDCGHIRKTSGSPDARLPMSRRTRRCADPWQPWRRSMIARSTMSCGERSFIVPRTPDDLVRRREAMRVWADATFGFMGRSPDYLNTLLASFADAPDFFAECGEEFSDNVQRYYRFCRDNDLF